MERKMAVDFKPLPAGPFSLIYADPPWLYKRKIFRGDTSSNKKVSAGDHYPMVKSADLMRLPVKEIAAKDCLLFLWTTGPFMGEAIALGEAWGFKYITIAFVWHKDGKIPVGNYTLPSCEFVLLLKRGKIPQPRGVRNFRQHVTRPVEGHSRKPAVFRNCIDDMFPGQSKIELFARKDGKIQFPYTMEEWVHWGDESGVVLQEED